MLEVEGTYFYFQADKKNQKNLILNRKYRRTSYSVLLIIRFYIGASVVINKLQGSGLTVKQGYRTLDS